MGVTLPTSIAGVSASCQSDQPLGKGSQPLGVGQRADNGREVRLDLRRTSSVERRGSRAVRRDDPAIARVSADVREAVRPRSLAGREEVLDSGRSRGPWRRYTSVRRQSWRQGRFSMSCPAERRRTSGRSTVTAGLGSIKTLMLLPKLVEPSPVAHARPPRRTQECRTPPSRGKSASASRGLAVERARIPAAVGSFGPRGMSDSGLCQMPSALGLLGVGWRLAGASGSSSDVAAGRCRYWRRPRMSPLDDWGDRGVRHRTSQHVAT